MAYDRYEDRGGWRDNDQRERGYRGSEGRGRDDDRGFFERARDEVQSWFGDEEAERRRHQDDRMSHSESSRYGQGRERSEQRGFGGSSDHRGRDDERSGFDRGSLFSGGQSSSYGRGRDEGDYRNQYGRGGGESGGFGGGSYERQSSRYPSGYGQTGGGSFQSRDRDDDRSDFRRDYERDRGAFFGSSSGRDRDDDYRPMTGDYGRGSSQSSRSGMGSQNYGQQQYGRQDFSQDQDRDRSGGQRYNYGGWGDEDSRRQSGGMMGRAAAAGAAAFGGSRSAHDDHYSSWRQRQIEDLDNDYEDYRREHQSKFENEFSGWRQQKQTKRQMLNSIQEHAEVVDQNGERIGTVDKVRGDKVILTKNDPEAGGVHRSFSCTLLEKVEDNKVYLSGTKDSIRSRLTEEREDDRSRSSGGILGGLFGSDRDEDRTERMREEQRSTTSSSSDGPHMLDRSFSGTYEDDSKTS